MCENMARNDVDIEATGRKECIACCDKMAVATVIEYGLYKGVNVLDFCRECMAKHTCSQWKKEGSLIPGVDEVRQSADYAELEIISAATSGEPSQFCQRCGMLLFKDSGCEHVSCAKCGQRATFRGYVTQKTQTGYSIVRRPVPFRAMDQITPAIRLYVQYLIVLGIVHLMFSLLIFHTSRDLSDLSNCVFSVFIRDEETGKITGFQLPTILYHCANVASMILHLYHPFTDDISMIQIMPISYFMHVGSCGFIWLIVYVSFMGMSMSASLLWMLFLQFLFLMKLVYDLIFSVLLVYNR